ncbi:hypothetical protein Poli38472_003823 [Pythium oligandrum]|uniref:Ankyrin repeat protein n=1 Tax=Pythium oligandrum TaxID=41045 RepID=A0A8K1FPX7_PYTOL|nr:hypothetical protein Poli38472_003823 [Pythium oligandrum]|eukprot:TMW66058.1 hypothetical protein Poli38472_003823 [Pythium oligandrum]
MALTTTQCVARADARIGALSHVLQLIDELLDGSVWYTPPRAAATRSVRLLERVIQRITKEQTDAALRMHWLSRAMVIAIQHSDLKMIQSIHKLHPEPLATDLFEVAVIIGDLKVLQWLFKFRSERLCRPEPPAAFKDGELMCCLDRFYDRARACGHVNIARWLFAEGYVDHAYALGNVAALQGNMEVVQWLYKQEVPLAFTLDAFRYAAQNGHLNVIKYLHQNNIGGIPDDLLDIATVYGHNEVVAYIREHSIKTKITPRIVEEAGRLGRLDILQWDHEFVRDVKLLQRAMNNAVVNGHLDVVKWLTTHRQIACGAYALERAAASGNLDILRWIHEQKNGDWTTDVMDAAASKGNLEMVKWLDAHRTEGCTHAAMDRASANGHLQVIQWLHRNRSEGCTLEAMDSAAASGHLEVVRWLHDHRLEGCTVAAMGNAAMNGHLDVVRWLHTHRTEGCVVSAMDHAAAVGHHLEMLIWLHENRTEGCSHWAMDDGSLDIVQWLHEHRTEGCTMFAMDSAAGDGDFALLQYLHMHRKEGVSGGAAPFVAEVGHLYILQWLYEHYPAQFDYNQVRIAAERGQRDHVLAWLDTFSSTSCASWTSV